MDLLVWKHEVIQRTESNFWWLFFLGKSDRPQVFLRKGCIYYGIHRDIKAYSEEGSWPSTQSGSSIL